MGIRAQGNPLASFLDVWSNTGLDAVTAAPTPSGPDGHTATGGIISDWVDPSPGNVYRTHIFTSTGTFAVSALSGTYPAGIEYLVVGGGGGGGYTAGSYTGGGGGGGGGGLNKEGPPNGYGGGGAGAGGLRTNLSGHPLAGSAFPVSASPGNYAVTVGAGGGGGLAITTPGTNGGNTSFGPITSHGGGYGASNDNNYPSPPAPAQLRGGEIGRAHV